MQFKMLNAFDTPVKPYQKHAAPHPSFYQKVHPDNLFGNQFGEETHYNTWQTQPDNFDKPSHRFAPKPDAATYGQGNVNYQADNYQLKLEKISQYLSNSSKKPNLGRNRLIKSQIFQNNWIISETSSINSSRKTMKDFKIASTN